MKRAFGVGLAVVVVLELGLRMVAPGAGADPRLRRSAVAEDPMLEPDPRLLWRFVPSASAAYDSFTLATNAAGFRGPEPVAPSVLCVGDSVTLGRGVELADSWPQRLAAMTGEEVLAAAVTGYSSHQGRLLLAQLLERYRPRFVVVSFGMEDARAHPVADARLAGDSLIELSAVGRRLRSWLDGSPERSALEVATLREELRATVGADGADAAARFATASARVEQLLQVAPARVSLADYRANLRAMARLANERGAKVIFVGPPYGGVAPVPDLADSRYHAPVADYRKAMHEVSREVGASFVSLPELYEGTRRRSALFVGRSVSAAERANQPMSPSAAFVKGLNGNRTVHYDLRHPAAAGHALLAEAIVGMIDPQRRFAAGQGR